jgi:hypothetical protein
MKKFTTSVAFCATLFTSSGVAQAALIDRGGGLIYDTDLNITWLQDANFAKTSGFDSDGKMDWNTAYNWAANLAYHDSVRSTDISGWRLPKSNMLFSDGNAPGIEMGYMFYTNLGNVGYYNYGPEGGTNSVFGLQHVGPFINFQSFVYWSNNEYADQPTRAFSFVTANGGQNANLKTALTFAWAVHDGDVAAVPEPETYALMLVGLGMMGFIARRRKNLVAHYCRCQPRQAVETIG